MRILILLSVILIVSCKTKQPAASILDNFTPDFTKGPPTIVYKARKDYRELVPVLLSDDKTRIVAYPGPNDIKSADGFPIPVELHDGYYLDHRGITKDAAFLKLTYEEYSQLEAIPPVVELYKLIVNADPLKEICDCGSQKAFTDIEKQLNDLIDSGKLREVCKVVK